MFFLFIKSKILSPLVTLLLLFPLPVLLWAGSSDEDLQQLTAVTHVHSYVSAARHPSLHAVASLAEKKDVDVLVPTDHFLKKWEYGFDPLPGILRVWSYKACVLKFGVPSYLSIIDKIQTPDLMTMPGLEITPEYSFSGHPARGQLVVHNSQKHLLVYGLTKKEDIVSLPVMSNPHAGEWDWTKIILPFLAVVSGLALMVRWPAGLLVVVFGLFWMLNQRPFHRLPVMEESVHGTEYAFSQHLIDYVREKGGWTVWAHPASTKEEKTRKYFRSVYKQTDPYPQALLKTTGYLGFGSSLLSDDEVIGAGGVWDQVLTEYAAGQRSAPVWCFAEQDCGEEAGVGLDIYQARNVLWVKKKTKSSVSEAFQKGCFYPTMRHRQGPGLNLKKWLIVSQDQTALSGGKVIWRPGAQLKVLLDRKKTFKITIIQNGSVWMTFQGWEKSVTVPLPKSRALLDYYRVLIETNNIDSNKSYIIVTNPIFVTM